MLQLYYSHFTICIQMFLFLRENLPGQFKFKEYCPQVFRNLRERFGIEDQDYQVWYKVPRKLTFDCAKKQRNEKKGGQKCFYKMRQVTRCLKNCHTDFHKDRMFLLLFFIYKNQTLICMHWSAPFKICISLCDICMHQLADGVLIHCAQDTFA